MKKYLNLGCGSRLHPAWTNVNFTKTANGVIAANISKGIPFHDESFDVVYHSHLLEHLPKSTAPDFLKECFRVMRPKGVIRIAAPDLEAIARYYLLALEKAKMGLQEWSDNYDWILLEMYDQVVRNYSGGEMAVYLNNKNLPNEPFIIDRCGVEVKRIIEGARQEKSAANTQNIGSHGASWVTKIRQLLNNSKLRREVLLKFVLKDEYNTLQHGRFRMSGEIHQWMYDSFSLGKLLNGCGFVDIVSRSAVDSYMPDWPQYHLDTEPDGSIYKPDSLFMEAIRP